MTSRGARKIASFSPLAAVVLVMVLGLAGSAVAQSGIFLGTPPSHDQLYISRLGYAEFDTHLLHVGQVVTEHAVNTSSAPPSGASTYEWVIPQNFEVVSGCVNGNYADGSGTNYCTLRALAPTLSRYSTFDCGTSSGDCFHNWTLATTYESQNAQGTGVSTDYFAILPGFFVQGQILDANGQPVSGADVTLQPSGDATVTGSTDGSGTYGAGLNQDPAVRVVPPAGYAAVSCPGYPNADGSCTIDLDHDFTIADGNPVDFGPATATTTTTTSTTTTTTSTPTTTTTSSTTTTSVPTTTTTTTTSSSTSSEPYGPPVGQIQEVKSVNGGDPGVFVVHPDGKVEKLAPGSSFYLGDTIVTTQGTLATVHFALGGEQGINGDSKMSVASERTLTGGTDPALLMLSKGQIWANLSAESTQKMFIQTNGGVVGIKG